MNGNGNKHSGTIGQILAFIGDSPWKALVIIVSVILGGVGWALYQQRDAIIEAWLTPSVVGLKVTAVPDALDYLAEETGADLLQIWSVDMSSNSQHFIAARRKDKERPVIPSPRRLPIIVNVSDAKILVDILEGHPVCVNLSVTGSPLARRLAERGMQRGCAITIPPNPAELVGVIYLAWEVSPEESVEKVAVGAARESAKKLITR